MNSTTPEKTENVNPLAATVKSVLYFLGGLFFAWNLLVLYAFSTMVDSSLPDRERNQEILHRFLFGDGIHHPLFVIVLFAAALMCFALSAMNLWSRVTGVQMETKKSKNITGTIVLALIVLGMIYFAFA